MTDAPPALAANSSPPPQQPESGGSISSMVASTASSAAAAAADFSRRGEAFRADVAGAARWGYHNLSVVEDVVENYWSAQIPVDVIWNDDDHMDARKDLMLSPVNYSHPKLLAFLDMLQFHWNQYDRNSCIFFHEYVSGIDKCDRNQYQMNYQNAIFDFSKLV
ncbi:Alpha-xylosidase [Hordeum vulgare]|nr:Alpha-xylosidase [Hordeum vulgare]